ncbi:MAG: ACT domain-containing protein [Ruminococcus sp.]|nr:ACT domain-containing protein [Oscillospiraceae bacterium]
MSIRQISVFVENKKGSLVEITETLARENIDLRAMSIADTQDFGILRLIVSDTDKAVDILRKEKCIVSVNDVIGVRMQNKPGALATVVKVLDDNNINMEYMYAFNGSTPHHSYLVLRVDDNERVAELLLEKGIKCITEAQANEL